MERTSDAAAVNALMSEAFGSPMDFTAQVEKPTTYAMIGEHGVMLFVASKNAGEYSLTMGIREEGRGAWATAFVRDVLEYMFTQTDAVNLWATALRANKHVMALASYAPGIEFEHNATHSFAYVTKARWSVEHANAA